MQLDSQGLQMQQAAETARREAGKLGMKVLQQQMQVRLASHASLGMARHDHAVSMALSNRHCIMQPSASAAAGEQVTQHHDHSR